ncbi:MAG: tetratricopeptide repeat protein [Melioribacteraceae bacterium]|nr:tetratricopeptide repeat protein [Melioribacteraceae bacterium]MCF8354560.1 tetratricopeptide repeat protein [Melioribacteraceae bacterium]MCF8394492.1 tetratricopeptide repeat protein [Melioribacteraceae bacterium]MCF8420098.1 tetratricopeptide repeat protein [Melioribacteraceae bacterium]
MRQNTITILFVIVCLFIFTSQNYSQKLSRSDEGLKRQAIAHMQAGRYGEAIDLFHKFVTANPQLAEGYNLRGLSYEKRSQYQYAVLDFRRAHRLEPQNIEIKENLDRALRDWHELLYKQIDGYKREIAIDPTNPFNYLEIGKAYRWLEEWLIAEEWYDQYLARYDDAPPDDIIRYTEILSHTKHIKKGEIILKKYVERYPEDWRLWSRYGYFTMWLGNYRNAEQAFRNALSFKPFFKEAQDGLDLATQKGYLTLFRPRSFEREYTIDYYFKVLKSNPDNDEIRFRLIDELIAKKRYEEAFEQVLILEEEYGSTQRYADLYNRVVEEREAFYTAKIDSGLAAIKTNPSDREATKLVAQKYSSLENYSEALEILSEYLQLNPDDDELRFIYAQNLAWDRRYEESYAEMKTIMENTDELSTPQKLLLGQLATWLREDQEIAEEYLLSVVEDDSTNISALITLGSLYFANEDIENAKYYAELARNVNPDNTELIQLDNMIYLHELREEQIRHMQKLDDARKFHKAGDLEYAIPLYEEYIADTNQYVDPLVYKDISDAYIAVEDYDNAVNILDRALSEGYNYELDKQRAKVYFWKGDSVTALYEFERLVEEEDSTDYETKIYLGDCYSAVGRPKEALAMYESVEDIAPEEYKIDERIGWLPPEAFEGNLWRSTMYDLRYNFLSYLLVSPVYYYFDDNLDFNYSYGGIGLETGVTSYLTIGINFVRGYVSSLYNYVNYTAYTGSINIKPHENWMIILGYGRSFSPGRLDHPIWDARIQHEVEDHYEFELSYLQNDAAFILYSPTLVTTRLTAHAFTFKGDYRFRNDLRVLGYYKFLITEEESYTTGNEGNNIEFRLGKKFIPNLELGYEYFFSDFRYNLTNLYYSPTDFVSHSLWGEWQVYKDNKVDVLIGGKLGYVPESDFIIRQLYTQIFYKPIEHLTLGLNAFIGSTVRESYGYDSRAIFFTAFWSIR